ncbi:MAG: glycoside hydrolase family 2 protein, partial [Oscillospiraceae bacterium]|nr:glycoside hydrolase family 2 protein [Oscillospiraceae bacterium]
MKKICFNKDWQFELGAPFEGRGKPRSVELPHDFMIEQNRDPASPTKRDGGYFTGGSGRYSKKFFAPADWEDKAVCVEFEGIYKSSEIWLNGNLAGRQNYGYTTFFVSLDKFLKYGAENELAVTVDNSSVPNSRWYSGSGIYRYAYLYVAPKSHIEPNGVYVKTESIKDGSAILRIQTKIVGGAQNYSIEHIIKDLKTGEIAARPRCDCCDTIEIKNPKIWDIDSPNLYVATTNYYVGDAITDTAETVFGIRSFSVDSKNGFVLNGRPLKLKGGCLHHDNGILGAASYARSEERKIEILKKSGFNAVRTAHNPPAPAFLDACDRLGMIVMDEAFDQWRCLKTRFDYHMNFDSDWERDLVAMVKRDRNHPSVMLWSIGNEIVEQKGDSDAAKTAKMLSETIKKYDDRPVGMAIMPYDRSLASNIEGIDSVV